MTPSFCRDAWARTADLRATIDAHPFNRELAAGTLEGARFAHYMVQDSLYLRAYSRVLSMASARAPGSDALAQFADSARGALQVEQALHETMMARFGVDEAAARQAEPSPTAAAYINFLLASAAVDPYEVLLAALLPCFWIYQDVGQKIAAEAAPGNPYQPWIDTYSDPGFAEAVEAVKRLTDEAARQVGPERVEAMHRAFFWSTRYEYLFWDAAYRQEAWPSA